MMPNKYQREIKPGVNVDVYDVLVAFNVTCPAMAHAIKKCLAPGQRGVKSAKQDKEEAIASIERSIDMALQIYNSPEQPPPKRVIKDFTSCNHENSQDEDSGTWCEDCETWITMNV